MAASGPRLGMQYVDPSPVATHTVPPEAMEGKLLIVVDLYETVGYMSDCYQLILVCNTLNLQ